MQGKVPRDPKKIQSRPVVAVALDVPTAENGSNYTVSFGTFHSGLAPGKDFLAAFFPDDESLVTPREDAPGDLHIPILERGANPFNLGFDGLFEG